MSWRLHHVNVPSPHLQKSVEFYGQVLGMQAEAFDASDPSTRGRFEVDEVITLREEDDQHERQVHLQVPNPNTARDNNWHINPISGPHTAYSVDSLDEVRERLRSRGIYFADAGRWALNGYDQIYLWDPGMNMVEINQLLR